METEELEKMIVGMNLADAKILASNNGVVVRMAEENGKGLICTCDYRFNRINVAVDNGIIARIISWG